MLLRSFHHQVVTSVRSDDFTTRIDQFKSHGFGLHKYTTPDIKSPTPSSPFPKTPSFLLISQHVRCIHSQFRQPLVQRSGYYQHSSLHQRKLGRWIHWIHHRVRYPVPNTYIHLIGLLSVHNPTTGKVLTKVSEGTAKDVDLAVDAAEKAFETTWGHNTSGSKRAALLNKLANIMEAHFDELCAVEALDNGSVSLSYLI